MADTRYIGIIGAGARGTRYVRFMRDFDRPLKLLGIADPSDKHIAMCRTEADHCLADDCKTYSHWGPMLADLGHRLDGVIIGTPNHLHHDPAIEAMNAGISAIALEKPLATTIEDCRHIVTRAYETDTRVQLGFVLRSAPFYRKVKQLLDDGAIGRVISIQADELVSRFVTGVMFRGPWRRNFASSGGSMLEKCCHDMDLLNWLADSQPMSLNSYGGQRIFSPNPAVPDSCPTCGSTDQCIYHQADQAERDAAEQDMDQYMKEHRTCIFNAPSDSMDHQSVQLLYRNGVVANFLMNFNTEGPRSGRNLAIIGTRGMLWGNYREPVVFQHDNLSTETIEHRFAMDDSGHGGGDRFHCFNFYRDVFGDDKAPVAGPYEGYLSAMMCIGADRSVHLGRQVNFTYPATRAIEIA